jgi:hypothetical protein
LKNSLNVSHSRAVIGVELICLLLWFELAALIYNSVKQSIRYFTAPQTALFLLLISGKQDIERKVQISPFIPKLASIGK